MNEWKPHRKLVRLRDKLEEMIGRHEKVLAYSPWIARKKKVNKRLGVRGKAKVKYRGPNGEGWSGRGLTPAWMRPLLEEGHRKGDFLVREASFPDGSQPVR